jgi:hypothetical protein
VVLPAVLLLARPAPRADGAQLDWDPAGGAATPPEAAPPEHATSAGHTAQS